MNKAISKTKNRIRRHARVRAKISGTKDKPRLAVFKSNKYVYAQLIDDEASHTLAAATSRGSDKKMVEQGVIVGKEIAKKAKDLNIKEVVFDRGGFLFAGVIKALADEARSDGLEF